MTDAMNRAGVTLRLEDQASWRDFLAGQEGTEALCSAVRRSWARSRDLGVDPTAPLPAEPIEEYEVLSGRRDELGEVRAHLAVAIGEVESVFGDNDFIGLLADATGVVTDRYAGGQFKAVADRVRLIDGAHWSEAIRGTNAIGTALTERTSVEVSGAAHFAESNHGLICYADVIREPGGATLAVFDATSYVERANPEIARQVAAVCRRVEHDLFRRAWMSAGLQIVQESVQRCQGPAFVVSRLGRVVCTSHQMRLSALDWLPTAVLSTVGDWTQSAAIDYGKALPLKGLLAKSFPGFRLTCQPVYDSAGTRIALAGFLERSEVRRPKPVTPESPRTTFLSLNGTDKALESTLWTAERVAPTRLPVLLLAETGTGKELLARELHKASDRSNRALVALNCGAVSPDLMASELFGYGPGAFTGAAKNGSDGRLAAADGSTLFLDEVAEMPTSLQVMLLRFLDDGFFYRVGENVPRHSDVRLVCATCRDLTALVEAGEFRRDLYHRINGVTLTLPALRDRDDLDQLTDTLLAKLAALEGLVEVPALSQAARQRLSQYTWPGNVRELRQTLHRAIALSGRSTFIEASDVQLETQPGPSSGPANKPVKACLADQQLLSIQEALERSQGNVSEAARELGVARSTIYRAARRRQFAVRAEGKN